ncbi:M1 family metallopeptidase [Terricaulis sp.]|uniref:M1 family metallopeptidase n=1 Tax=Terricaulis sp. TaxID=2768686 RepID=UPI0037847DBE
MATPVLSACATMGFGPVRDPMAPLPHDPDSYARPDEARVTHVSIDLKADFERKVLAGWARLDIVARPDAREIVLDVDGLAIGSVSGNGRELPFTIGAAQEGHGSPMTIQLNGARQIKIVYETSPDASALGWMTPEQTASGKQFLFSQGQSIYTRSWIPTQDSPGIRQTFDARITAPEGLRAVMAAEMLTPDGEPVEGGRAYRFRMTHPIPCYLFAIAIGDLQHRAISYRTGVWAEPSVADAAAYEFADMERMLRVAETLYGPYRWGKYEVLVLPPSFPYGGMENPRLTFATPTSIAGDRSLVALIAHEMAHSWSGNLVTNALWVDSWLNEGFTSYIEARISEALYGEERANMARALDWAGIQAAITSGPPDVTRLHLLRSSDEQPSAITYDKGALFLRTIEQTIGRRELDSYLRGYFDRHAFQPITTEAFLADFREHVVRGDADLEARLKLDEWAYEPGLPSNAQEPHAAAFDRVAEQVTAFNAGAPASALPWASWGTFERQRFLQTIPRRQTRARLDEMEQALQLNELGNMEVLFDWQKIVIANHYDAGVPSLENFLKRQGRGKFVRPLYTDLMRDAWGQPIARRIYAQARQTYHPIVVAGLDRIVR